MRNEFLPPASNRQPADIVRIQKAIYSISFAVLCACGLSPALAYKPAAPPTHEVILKKAELVEGHRYPAGTKLHVYDHSGKVQYVHPGGNIRMNGHLILRGTQMYMRDGKPMSYFSVLGQKINRILLPKNSQVCFNKKGGLHMISLPHGTRTRIEGKFYPGGEWIFFDAHGKVIPEEQAEAPY